ncbi:MAG: hypothetical protein IT207_08095 [Fimbriimonadaceae bacterium]|nr:hypothetical protein [Fimbriimonadaceae bacterium]
MRPRALLALLVAFAVQAGFAQSLMYGVEGKIAVVLLPEVKKELKLTRDQEKAITKAMEEETNSFSSLSVNREYLTIGLDEKITPILDEKQAQRLEELWFQRNGRLILRLQVVAARFKIEQEVHAKIQAIARATDAKILEQLQMNRGRSLPKEIRALKDAASNEIAALLTPEQESAWQSANGRPFKFKE